MKLSETINSTEQLTWHTVGKFQMCAFLVNDLKFIIQLEQKKLSPLLEELRQTKNVEVSFFRDVEDNVGAFSTTKEFNSIPSKVYGIIVNGVQQQFENYDSFYFSLEKRHSRNEKEFLIKQHIYEVLVDKIKRHNEIFIMKKKIIQVKNIC